MHVYIHIHVSCSTNLLKQISDPNFSFYLEFKGFFFLTDTLCRPVLNSNSAKLN